MFDFLKSESAELLTIQTPFCQVMLSGLKSRDMKSRPVLRRQRRECCYLLRTAVWQTKRIVFVNSNNKWKFKVFSEEHKRGNWEKKVSKTTKTHCTEDHPRELSEVHGIGRALGKCSRKKRGGVAWGKKENQVDLRWHAVSMDQWRQSHLVGAEQEQIVWASKSIWSA